MRDAADYAARMTSRGGVPPREGAAAPPLGRAPPRRAQAVGSGQATPVECTGQYPFGTLCRYCWWYSSA